MLGSDGEYLLGHPEGNFLTFELENCENSTVKHSIEKSVLLSFVNLSANFYRRLS